MSKQNPHSPASNQPGMTTTPVQGFGAAGSNGGWRGGARGFGLPMIARGESTAARIGLVGSFLVVAMLMATGWWTLHTASVTRAEERRERMAVVAGLLGASAENLLAGAGRADLSGLRRLVMEASLNYRLSACRVKLPDGRVLASANPREVTAQVLPEPWPAAKANVGVGEGETAIDGQARTVIAIPGKGEAVLELTSAEVGGTGLMGGFAPMWEALAGVGAIGVVSMGAMLVCYRLLRSRLRTLGAIQEALSASAGGETEAAALVVAPDLGPEASAWNAILHEREALRQRVVAEKVEPRLASKGRGDGDLASVCDALWHGLVLVDENLKVKYANGAAAIFLALKREEMPGMELSRVVEDAALQTAVRSVVDGKARGRQVVEIRRDQDSRSAAGTAAGSAGGEGSDGAADRRGGRAGWGGGVLRLSIRPVRREDSAAVMILIEDVTQQRVADEARNGFVAQATHELRTPLTTMRLYIEQVQEDDALPAAERAKAINVINQECRRLERIVADMLSVSEIEAGSLRLHEGDVRLAQLIADLKQDFEPQAKSKSITLRFDIPPKLPVLKGDRDKIMLAAHNLLGNAVKYTPEGGQVSMRVEESAGQLAMEFVDNGIGIREDEHEKIFDKFYRAKDKRIANITGSGLGLALAREVARLHGGDIVVRSQMDKGSTFILTLPLGKAGGASGNGGGSGGAQVVAKAA